MSVTMEEVQVNLLQRIAEALERIADGLEQQEIRADEYRRRELGLPTVLYGLGKVHAAHGGKGGENG